MVQEGLRRRLILPGGQYPDHVFHSFTGPAPPLPFHAIAVEPVIRFCSTQKDGRETVISVIYKKGVIVLFSLNCIFSKVFKW